MTLLEFQWALYGVTVANTPKKDTVPEMSEDRARELGIVGI